VAKRENILVAVAAQGIDYAHSSKGNVTNWQINKSNIASNVQIFHA
jgi:hypothetical protein